MSFPPFLHQYWHAPQLPPEMRALVDENLALNPGYASHLSDEAAAEAFLSEHFGSDARHAFQLARPQSFKADLWRFAVLAKIGGAYIDVKIRMTRAFDALYSLASSDGALFVRDVPRGAIWTAIIAAPPNNPVLERTLALAVDNVLHRRYGVSPLDVTGPQVFGRASNELIGVAWDTPITFGAGARCGLRLATRHAICDAQKNLVAVSEAYAEYRARDAPIAARYDVLWNARRCFDER